MRTLSLLMGFLLGVASVVQAEPLRVCATTPDLGDLVRQVGGDEVAVTVFAKSSEDPHFIDAKPGFIAQLSRADMYVETGLELEVGWAPVLLQNARNKRVLPGGSGYVDASSVITPMEVPTGPVDRSMGDIHAAGNPHYLLDPEAGRAVARLLATRLATLRPERKEVFQQRLADFEQWLDQASVRWREALGRFAGSRVVVDHNLWPYFAQRFDLRIGAFLEPKPGLPPTTKHLASVIERMQEEGIRVVLASPYFDERHSDFVIKQTGARLARLAHQVGSRPGTEDYLAMMEYNVKELATALTVEP
jgi:zinc/manganese transport system substrate-binding protein